MRDPELEARLPKGFHVYYEDAGTEVVVCDYCSTEQRYTTSTPRATVVDNAYLHRGKCPRSREGV